MAPVIWAVVPAGGAGARMNAVTAKQYLLLNGQPMIEHTLMRLAQITSVNKLVVGIACDDAQWQGLNLSHQKLLPSVEAGAHRVDTVRNCLKFIVAQGGGNDWALVHDAARPCVRQDEVLQLIELVLKADQGGILAVPVSDTLKRGSDAVCAEIIETVPRENLWRAMTPQMFKVGTLLSAIEQACMQGIKVTDEASAMEAAGHQPLLISSSPDNIKITFPEDMHFAEVILNSRQENTL